MRLSPNPQDSDSIRCMDKRSLCRLGIAWVVLFSAFIIGPRVGNPIIAALVAVPLTVCTFIIVSYFVIFLASKRRQKAEDS